jgi:hypothetical protein
MVGKHRNVLNLRDVGLLKRRDQASKLNENLEYYALSYGWGDLTVTKDILVNGKVFAATINLAAALRPSQ